MTRGRILKLAVGFGFSLFFVVLAVQGLDTSAFWSALGQTDPLWISIAVLSFAVGYACRVERWRLMLVAGRQSINFGTCAVPFLVSVAANNILPFRAGDALRVVGFTKWLGVDASKVLATLLVERMLDMLSLLAALALALTLVAGDVSRFENLIGAGAYALTSLAFIIVIILLRPRVFSRIAKATASAIGRFSSGLGNRLDEAFEKILMTLEYQAQGPKMFRLVIWSILAWAFEGGVFYATARALPSFAEIAGALVAFPVATLSTLLPSTPGYVGTFDYFAIQTAEMFGNPLAVAAAFAVLVHLILWFTATLAGAVSLLIWLAWNVNRPKQTMEDPAG